MSIFNIFGKKDVGSELMKNPPYKIVTELVPYHIESNKKSSATIFIKLTNLTSEPVLTSVVVETPAQLGFDEMGLSKQKEIRVGNMEPGEEKELKVELFGGLNTDKGNYTLSLTAIMHYRDYGHVINAVKKHMMINAV
ncbi:MAG: hypothetical protein QXK65_02885 [Candidatus Micrarchaeaceae archaeon]